VSEKSKDQIRLRPEIGLGQGAAIRRCGKGFSFGNFTEMKDGQPLPEGAELIHVGASDDDGWRDVTPIYERRASGPPQVATPAYRAGYARIFGKKQEVGVA